MDMDAPFASSIGAQPIQAPHRREPRIGAIAGAKGLLGSAFAAGMSIHTLLFEPNASPFFAVGAQSQASSRRRPSAASSSNENGSLIRPRSFADRGSARSGRPILLHV